MGEMRGNESGGLGWDGGDDIKGGVWGDSRGESVSASFVEGLGNGSPKFPLSLSLARSLSPSLSLSVSGCPGV